MALTALDAATQADAAAGELLKQVSRTAELVAADPTPKNKAAFQELFAKWRQREAAAAENMGADVRTTLDPLARLRTIGLVGSEFLALRLPPLAFLDEHGLVPAESVVVPFSAPNVGKTFLACEVIAGVCAAGQRVLCYQQEGTVQKFQERIERAFKAHVDAPADSLLIVHGSDVNLFDDDGVDRVIAEALRFQARMLVFDSLAACAGDLDENDPGAMGTAANNLNRIKLAARAAVFAPHHMTKEGWREGTVPSLRHLRGHSALAARIDVAFGLVAAPNATPDFELAFDIYDLKQRDAAKVEARRCTVAMPKAGPAATFGIFTVDQRAERVEKKKQAETERRKQMADAMVEALRTAPKGLKTGELRGLVSGRTELKNEVLRSLLTEKKIVREYGRLFLDEFAKKLDRRESDPDQRTGRDAATGEAF